MTAAQQATFIKSYLGPALQAAGLTTKIVVYDHNADHPEYATSILDDAAAKAFVDGRVPSVRGYDRRAHDRPQRAPRQEPLLHRAVHGEQRQLFRRPALAHQEHHRRSAGELEPHRARVEPGERRELRPAHGGRLQHLPRRRDDQLVDVGGDAQRGVLHRRSRVAGPSIRARCGRELGSWRIEDDVAPERRVPHAGGALRADRDERREDDHELQHLVWRADRGVLPGVGSVGTYVW